MTEEKPLVKIIPIAAMDEARVIGKEGGLPWRLPEDMKRFSALTTGHAVLMGRKTYESIPAKYRPLPNRLNMVISRDATYNPKAPNVLVHTSPEYLIAACRKGEIKLPSETIWVIGGAEIYKETLPYWDEIELTLVKGFHGGDAFFPPFEDQFNEVERRKGEGVIYIRYQRKPGGSTPPDVKTPQPL